MATSEIGRKSSGLFPAVPLKVNYSQRDLDVVVTPQDEDRFMLKVEEVIRACGMYKEMILPSSRQFDHLLSELAKWLIKMDGKFSNAFLTIQDQELLFLMIQKEKECDFGLLKELAILDVNIANDERFNLINLSVLALPNASEDALAGFKSPKFCLEFKHAD